MMLLIIVLKMMIITFYKELQTRVNEGASINGLYKSYFEDLVELVEIVKDKKESEIVKLETYKLVFNSLENYGYDFKADDIKKNQVIALFNDVKKEVETIKTSSTKTTAMKDYVNSRKEAVNKALENAYLTKEMEVD